MGYIKNGGLFMLIKTCCFISTKEIKEENLFFTSEKIRGAVKKAIDDGYTNFISSFENMIDLIFADIVTEYMQANSSITLEGAISNSSKLDNNDYFFNRLLSKCNTVGVTSIQNDDCTDKRNRLMIDFSQMVIFLNENDFTHYAKRNKKEIIIIKD